MNNPTFLQLLGLAVVILVFGIAFSIITNGFPNIIVYKKCNCKKKNKHG